MARAYGSRAHLLMERETAYGQAATGNYIRMPFNRCNLGREQGLIDDPTLGERSRADDVGRNGRTGRIRLAIPLPRLSHPQARSNTTPRQSPRYPGLWCRRRFGPGRSSTEVSHCRRSGSNRPCV
jgi:hypothetical protein